APMFANENMAACGALAWVGCFFALIQALFGVRNARPAAGSLFHFSRQSLTYRWAKSLHDHCFT
ncbi:hypothetical protein, partial [Polaromonas sp.]|uniref:hypothetical protein n=1 Tax=Polaromonas sp. TaxID=1869339 RepID=UPI0025FFEC68